MSREIITSTAKFTIYEKYILAEPKTFTNVDKKEVDELYQIVSNTFEGKFGLIEYRKSECSINPSAYEYAKELMPNFYAFALVTSSNLTIELWDMEADFMEGIEHKLFSSIEEAQEWMESILKKANFRKV